jgi:two-component system OmpR family response regulator
MASILVIEDDAETAREIADELRVHGHTVHAEADGQNGLERALREPFDAITLDRMLPGLDGLAVVARLRAAGIVTPVLMISALGDVDARIDGLRAGGDDYLIKPFAPDEMAMRVEVLLRRRRQLETAAAMLRGGPVEMDLIRREVRVDGDPVRLLHMEFRLLEFLMRNAGEIVTRQIIFERVWGYYFDPGANLINVHIARLRKKIDRPGHASLIATVKGRDTASMPGDWPHLRDIRKTSTFRLTLALGGAATVGVLLLLLIIYSLTERELNDRSDRILRTEIARLAALPEADLPGKSINHRRRVSAVSTTSACSPGGRWLAGDMGRARPWSSGIPMSAMTGRTCAGRCASLPRELGRSAAHGRPRCAAHRRSARADGGNSRPQRPVRGALAAGGGVRCQPWTAPARGPAAARGAGDRFGPAGSTDADRGARR